MIFRREPALVSGFVAAAVALAIAFGLDLTDTQVGAIMAAVTALLALIVRSQVTPVASPRLPRHAATMTITRDVDVPPTGP
ncbi:MAG: hypothetical protein ACRCZP_11650 [Phycicoccus sp.]